jgi:iron(III) transport system substrate-binding protein
MKNITYKILLSAMILSLAAACAPSGPAEPEKIVETIVIEKEGETVIVTATPESEALRNLDPDQRAWLEAAELGPFAPDTQDWEAIEAAAKEEGQVMIYSVSSRIFKLQEEFMEKYGVEIVAFDLASEIQLEKLRRENKAGIYEVDVIFNSDTPTVLNEFLPKGLVWNFKPDSVIAELDPEEIDPLLTQRWSSRVLFYNTAVYPDGPPIDNLWDLTQEEWSGKVLMPDPLENAVQMNALQTILQHADEMEAAYEAEYGEAITYSEDMLEAIGEVGVIEEPDAAIEWLYRFMQNDPVFLSSTTTIWKNISDVTNDDPPVGMTTFSKLRDFEAGVYESGIPYDVNPVFGVSYPTVLLVADRAPHPNAAKLLIRYMMEDGFWPWNEPGDYSSRTSVVEQQVADFGIPTFEEAKMWPIDQTYVYDTKFSFLTLYLELK